MPCTSKPCKPSLLWPILRSFAFSPILHGWANMYGILHIPYLGLWSLLTPMSARINADFICNIIQRDAFSEIFLFLMVLSNKVDYKHFKKITNSLLHTCYQNIFLSTQIANPDLWPLTPVLPAITLSSMGLPRPLLQGLKKSTISIRYHISRFCFLDLDCKSYKLGN